VAEKPMGKVVNLMDALRQSLKEKAEPEKEAHKAVRKRKVG